jgi:hypothetical protein
MQTAEHPWRDAIDIPVATASVDLKVGGHPGIKFSDLVIDGSTNTKVTSAANPFVAADVGKLLVVTGGTGFTAGVYYIASVAVGVATLSGAVGTVASTGGTGYYFTDCRSLYVGGAGNVVMSTIARPTVYSTFTAVPVGILPIRPVIVRKAANGTTATTVLGLFA